MTWTLKIALKNTQTDEEGWGRGKITDRNNTSSIERLYSSLFTLSLLANDKIIALIIYSSRKLITNIIVQSPQLIKFNSMLVHFRFSFSADYTKDLFGLQLVTLEGRKELEPNCVPHLLLGRLLGTSPLRLFSLSLVTVPEVFSKLYSGPDSSFLKWRISF